MLKIKKDDTVRIIAGKDKGREGKVLSVDPAGHRILVEGCNIVTKHQKPSPGNPQGGIINKEAPLDISNVALVVGGQTTRVGFRTEDGRKVRVAKKTGQVIK